MENAKYTLSTLLSDSATITSAIIEQIGDWIGLFTSNSALLWVFIGGVSMLALKLIRGLF